MNFLSRILRFLFWLLVLSWSVVLLRRAVAWMLRSATQTRPQDLDATGNSDVAGTPRRLIRDPVCGAHVAEVLAIPLRDSGEVLHFCSIACRDQYVRGTKKLAANG